MISLLVEDFGAASPAILACKVAPLNVLSFNLCCASLACSTVSKTANPAVGRSGSGNSQDLAPASFRSRFQRTFLSTSLGIEDITTVQECSEDNSGVGGDLIFEDEGVCEVFVDFCGDFGLSDCRSSFPGYAMLKLSTLPLSHRLNVPSSWPTAGAQVSRQP